MNRINTFLLWVESISRKDTPDRYFWRGFVVAVAYFGCQIIRAFI